MPLAKSLKELVRLLVNEFTHGRDSPYPRFPPSRIHDCRIGDRQKSKCGWVVLLTCDTKMSKKFGRHV